MKGNRFFLLHIEKDRKSRKGPISFRFMGLQTLRLSMDRAQEVGEPENDVGLTGPERFC
jgi:hypothetical protein